jgi:hypothetical protein
MNGIQKEDILMSKLHNSNNNTKNEPPTTPRWVKVSGIIVITLVLLVVIMKLTGIGGNHGPGRHLSEGKPQIKQEVPTEQTRSSDHMTARGEH